LAISTGDNQPKGKTMIFNLKALALVLAMMLTVSAVAAAEAFAQGKLTSDGPSTLIGTQTTGAGPMTLTGSQTGAASANSLTAFGGSLECSASTYSGRKVSATPHAFIPSGASTITITPQYGGCTGVGVRATVDMNGCDYTLTIEGTTGADSYAAKTAIQCTAGEHIQFTIFEDEGHTKGFCSLTVTQNVEGYGGLTVKNTTNGTLDLTGAASGLTVHKKGSGILCAEEATTEKAELHVDIAFTGAKGIVDEGGQGQLTADGRNALTIGLAGFKLECPKATYTGHKNSSPPIEKIPNGSTEITVTPHYGVCGVPTALPTTVDMNGCDYKLDLGASTGVDEFAVKLTVLCPEGQHIKITMFTNATLHTESKPFCETTLTENAAGYSGLEARDTTNNSIDVAGVIENLTYHKKSPGGKYLLRDG
jgi:hypothetical protein